MVKLLCKASNLAGDLLGDVRQFRRHCPHCDDRVEESAFHMIMTCSYHTNNRISLMHNVHSSLSQQSIVVWNDLSDLIKFNVLMGVEFPFPADELLGLRKASCVFIHKMYLKRKK